MINDEDKEAINEDEAVLERDIQVTFVSLQGVHLTPFVDHSGRVKFKGRKEPILKALALMTENPHVGILDVANRLSAIRSIIFGLKSQGVKNGVPSSSLEIYGVQR